MTQPVFPQNIKFWTDKQDNIDDVFAGDINNAYAETIAIQKYIKPVADTGIANAYIATVENVTAYFEGLQVLVKIASSNTGASTININGLGAKSIKKEKDVDLSPNDLKAGQYSTFIYDGTNFQLVNAVNGITPLKLRVDAIEADVSQTLQKQPLALDTIQNVRSVMTRQYGLCDVEIKGQVTVNLLGSDGDGEDASKFGTVQATKTLDPTNKVFGNNSIKATLSGAALGHCYIEAISKLAAGKYYMASAYLKNGNLATGVQLVFYTNDTLKVSPVISAGSFIRTGFKVAPTDFDTATYARISAYLQGADTQLAWIDGVMLIEITADEYNNLTVDQLMAKYPYVNGVQPLVNPCVTIRWKNLFNKERAIKGFEINSSNGTPVANASYFISDFIRVKPNTTYCKNTTNRFYWYDENRNFIDKSASGVASAISPINTKYLRLEAFLTVLDTFQLEEGTIATTYEPYKEAKRIYPCELAKIGTYQDKLIDVNGKAKKIWKIKKYTLQASDVTNFDNVGLSNVEFAMCGNEFLKKLGGDISLPTENKAIVSGYTGVVYATATWNTLTNLKHFSISSADGRMALIVPKGTYANLAAAQAALAGTIIYYVLATETEETIIPMGESALEIFEGSNTVDISTGVVYERANPKVGTGNLNKTAVYLNTIYSASADFGLADGTQLKYKTLSILNIFKDKAVDPQWSVDSSNAYGKYKASIPTINFDPIAQYDALYEVLHEEHDCQSFEATFYYPDNLRTSHNGVVETVAQQEKEINELSFDLKIHQKDLATDADGAHGMKIESGVWTPSLSAETTAPTVTYTTMVGKYLRVGKLVRCLFSMSLTATGGAGTIIIAGLPFMPVSSYEAGSVGQSAKSGVGLNFISLTNTGSIDKFRIILNTGLPSNISLISDGATVTITGSFVYEIAS